MALTMMMMQLYVVPVHVAAHHELGHLLTKLALALLHSIISPVDCLDWWLLSAHVYGRSRTILISYQYFHGSSTARIHDA